MQTIILAGGLGTRLASVAAGLPKGLVPILGRPFLAHVVDLLRENGLRDLLVLHGHRGDQLERALGDGRAHGVSIRYRHDGDVLLGTGGALRNALDLLEERFFVLYGDTFLDIDYGAVERAFVASGRPALMTVFHNAGKLDASNVEFGEGKILRYSKRSPTAEMAHIDYGLAVLTKPLIAAVPPGKPADLADLYAQWVAAGQVAGFEVFQRFYEIGKPEGLQETEGYLRVRTARPPVRLP